MFGGLGFDEFAIVAILAGLFFKKGDVNRAITWWKKTRSKLSNWQFDVEEQIDYYTQDGMQSARDSLQKLHNTKEPTGSDNTTGTHKTGEMNSSSLVEEQGYISKRQLEENLQLRQQKEVCLQQSQNLVELITSHESFQNATSLLVYSQEDILQIPNLDLLYFQAEEENKKIYYLKSIDWIDQDIDLVILPSNKANPYGERSYEGEDILTREIKNLNKRPKIISAVYSSNYILSDIDMGFNSLFLDFMVHPIKGVVHSKLNSK